MSPCRREATAKAPYRRTHATASSTAATACSISGIALRRLCSTICRSGKGSAFTSTQKWANTLLGNWQVEHDPFSAQTALPFAPVLANSVANTGASSRAQSGCGLASLQSDAYAFLGSIPRSTRRGASAGSRLAQFTYGNAGRGILRGPGRSDVNFPVFKEFPIAERFHLQFQ